MSKELPEDIKNVTPSIVWGHGHDNWRWSEDAGCYISGSKIEIPKEICLGERYAHPDHGKDSFGIIWRGSLNDDWHGESFYTMGIALQWVRSAKRPDLGFLLWSGFGKQRPTADKYAPHVPRGKKMMESTADRIETNFAKGHVPLEIPSGYRLLEKGEEIKEGDCYFHPNLKAFKLVDFSHGYDYRLHFVIRKVEGEVEINKIGSVEIAMPRYYEDWEICGWCGRTPGTQHKGGCRQ